MDKIYCENCRYYTGRDSYVWHYYIHLLSDRHDDEFYSMWSNKCKRVKYYIDCPKSRVCYNSSHHENNKNNDCQYFEKKKRFMMKGKVDYIEYQPKELKSVSDKKVACKNCGAVQSGDFCEYCGSALSSEED